MPYGRVRWFNKHFGYGFITSKKGEDIFVHYTSITTGTEDKDSPPHHGSEEYPKWLLENEVVKYSFTDTNGRLKATRVEKLETKKNRKL